jgi:phospholipid/cholesterol/gamma-HCH transport system ATP-binding protein
MMGESPSRNGSESRITVRDLTMAYGSFVLMREMSFTVKQGDVFIIMGASGSGKSTLLRHLIGLNQPAHGSIHYQEQDFTTADLTQRERILRNVGVLFQGGALWSAMTLSENIGLLLEEYTDLTPAEIRQVASLKLALVGLKGFEDYYPSQISGGMQKRAGLARAMALDPALLFFDEPSAGLDPINARRLDELILNLRDSLGMTGGGGDPRSGQHLRHWDQQHLPRRAEPRDHRERPSKGAAGPHPRSHPPELPDAGGDSHDHEPAGQSNADRRLRARRSDASRNSCGLHRLGSFPSPDLALRALFLRVGERPAPGSAGQVPRRGGRFG